MRKLQFAMAMLVLLFSLGMTSGAYATGSKVVPPSTPTPATGSKVVPPANEGLSSYFDWLFDLF
ncbi:hypothetical protein [Shewanella marina]|uniref:hypothetical protein n=1 Tax=Shewanella marina TaxID=487319 RepID=UPI00047226D3|nr:hypothetical protein [Shewanella marina]